MQGEEDPRVMADMEASEERNQHQEMSCSDTIVMMSTGLGERERERERAITGPFIPRSLVQTRPKSAITIMQAFAVE